MQSAFESHVGLVFNQKGAFFVSAGDPSQWRILDPHVPVVLEIFTHHHSLADAHRVYEATRGMRAEYLTTLSQLLSQMVGGQAAMLLIKQKVLVCASDALAQAFMLLTDGHASPHLDAKASGIRDLTTMSKSMPFVAAALQKQFHVAGDYPALTLEEFRALTEQLTAERLLTVPIGGIDFGDFKREEPFCPRFGNLRGTAIDRYYLNKFVAEIRNEVKGVTLEIGGSKANRELYKFTNATSYLTMDLMEGADLDVVGDAHDPRAVDNASLDSVVLFNVLEHCERPWVVVDNIYQWLKPRGQVFCLVPNAQRVHRYPKDYWRILPDAMDSLFARFPQRKLYVYGNPLTTLAAYYGIASDELTQEELDYYNDNYPVANCIHAQK